MVKLFDSVYDVVGDIDKIRKRPYGMIEVVNEKLVAVHLRPWPKLISGVEAKWADGWARKRAHKNQCQVYYSQPFAHRNFLSLSYAVTTLQTSWTTLALSLAVLDYVAYAKSSDAIVTEVSNQRVSNRLMRRLGYERHYEESKKRHWIKRFYGEYSESPLLQRKLGITFDSKRICPEKLFAS